ncbi:pyruvate kinase [Nocardioides sp. Soil777]|uniref:pyruvate kinase n=1 Tax=Nocardioides sp. Soil777 TaxID=1736409 RepID=UPI000702967E|nr:pyruvate kinase [Nocardioides sp. Soil777]KRE99674.1 pyruvate kinase [Nocardioides sp. Soil777]
MRRAKIVCTLGPAVSTPERVRELVDAGMDVARLNMSHGAYADHEAVYTLVRRASDESGHGVGIFADLQGPKIRLATFADGPVKLKRGATFTITTRDVPGDVDVCGTTYKGLPGDVKVGDPVLIDDGKLRLRVVDVTETDVVTEVVVGGKASNNKGINLPGVAVSVPALSEKDTEDLRWALHLGVDFIALSFVRSAADAEDVRKVMREEGIVIPVIAKIEKPQAIDNIDEIVDAFDGLMVARGDLGVECPLEDVPIHQKRIIEKARRNAKPVIVATQMLESMIGSPAPTRAEASDVANAVLDGADAVMLSGETSVGEHPITAVQTMARIIESTEDHGLHHMRSIDWQPHTRGGIIAKAAAEVAEAVGAKFLVAFTVSGDSAKRLSRYRGPIPVLAFTPEARTRSQLALTWGVETFQGAEVEHTDEMVRQVDEALLHIGRVDEGDLVVIIAGSPPGIPGSTNALRIHRMGDAINGVAPAYRRPR